MAEIDPLIRPPSRRVSAAALLALLTGVYLCVADPLVEALYKGGLPLADRLIQNQDRFPLEHYRKKADHAAAKAAVWLAVLIGIGVPLGKVSASKRPLGYFLTLLMLAVVSLRLFGHDTVHHLFNLGQVCKLLAAGQWPVYLLPDIAQGRELPVFVYYSVWAYLLPAALHLIAGVGPFLALKLTFIVLTLISACGMYHVLKKDGDGAWAAAGTLLYLSSNIFLGALFVRFAFTEFLALTLLPPTFLYLRNWLEGRRTRDALALIALYTLVLLFHPLTFANISIGLILYAVFSESGRIGGDARRWGAFLVRAGAVMAAVMLLTAFYWVPFVIERPFVVGDTAKRALEESFLTLSQYVDVRAYQGPGPLINGLVLLSAARLFGLRKARARIGAETAGLALIVGIYIFLQFPCSSVVWGGAGLMRANQFVWRLVLPLAFFAVVLASKLLRGRVPAGRVGGFLRAVTVAAFIQAGVFAAFNFAGAVLVPQSHPIESEEVERFSRSMDVDGVAEFLPDISRIPLVEADRIVGAAGISADGRFPGRYKIELPAAGGYRTVEKYWNTRHRLVIDGRIEAVKAAPDGRAVVLVPAGARSAFLEYSRPDYVRYSQMLSLGAWILFAAAWAALLLRSRPLSGAGA